MRIYKMRSGSGLFNTGKLELKGTAMCIQQVAPTELWTNGASNYRQVAPLGLIVLMLTRIISYLFGSRTG